MGITLAVHIAAGGLGIVLGFVALSAAKGAGLHRRSGMLFVYSMVTMGLLGAAIAAARGIAPGVNVPVGLLTAYLVTTGLTTVRPPSDRWRWLDRGLMLVVLAVSLTLFASGLVALTTAKGTLYGMPALPFFIFGSIGLLATIGDLRVIGSGGARAIRGVPRLRRHLWRMSTALTIAAFSFFLGQAKVIPKPIRIVPLLVIPPLTALFAMVYWLWRVRAKGTYPAASRIAATTAETATGRSWPARAPVARL